MRLLTDQLPTSRVGRYPKHTFRVNSLPFTLQPVGIARVLPAETLKAFNFESRVVTSPVLNPIIGWKKEYYLFYIKVSDLMNDAIRNMFIDPENQSITAGVESANSQAWYTAKNGINWLKLCTQRVWETYFSDEGDAYASYLNADGLPRVQVRENTFMQSLTDEDLMPQEAVDLTEIQNMNELQALMDAYERLQALNLANMTYEDWLKSNGIAVPAKDENKPELVARFAEWQYPTNHISTDPTTAGSATSALSWIFRNKSLDPKFFKEPGFLCLYSVARPKIYFGGLAGSAAGFANRAWDWAPNYLHDLPRSTLKHFGVDTGPLGERTTDADGYWLDMRDELLYGDQFQNIAAFNNAAATPAENLLPLPLGTSINYKYPTEASCKAFFTVDTGRIRQDGYFSLSVKGFQVDMTKGNVAEI